MKRFSSIATIVLAAILSFAQELPKLAVWNPRRESPEERVTLEPEAVQRLAKLITENKLASVTHLTAEQIEKGALLSDDKSAAFDAFLIVGSSQPRAMIPAIKDFAKGNGVMFCVNQGVPMLICLEKDTEGEWILSPQTPKFAWQTNDLLKYFGLNYQYKPEYHDLGVVHEPRPLFQRYAPEAKTIRGKLPSRWIIPRDEAKYIPLIRSTRSDGLEVPGPLYLIQKENHNAIICLAPFLVDGSDTDIWPDYIPTLRGVLRLASDIRNKKVDISSSDEGAILADPGKAPQQPLDALTSKSVEPDNAVALQRWGRFDGSRLDLDARSTILPPKLLPGQKVELPLSLRNVDKSLPCFVRVRGAYTDCDAGLSVQFGGNTLWKERFITEDAIVAGNFSASYKGQPYMFNRIMHVPSAWLNEKDSRLVIGNPGMEPVYFDAVQIEQQPTPRTRCIGLNAADGSAPTEESQRWGAVRLSLRTQRILEDGDNRFAQIDKIVENCLKQNAVLQPILEGTPEWMAISSERLEEAKTAKRPSTVPPNPDQYIAMLEELIPRYRDHFDAYEVWNEADITQFYRGSAKEYATLYLKIEEALRRLDPGALVMPCGMAGVKVDFLEVLRKEGVLDRADCIALHPYVGKSSVWDLPMGMLENYLYSKGLNLEIYCNESGFPSVNCEWFQPPPEWTPTQQAKSLNVAMARILANGLSRLLVFQAGGTEQAYGLFYRGGKPKTAYSVFSDYAYLSSKGAARLDVSMVREDGEPLSGVYVASTRHADGSVTIVLNPAEAKLKGALPVRILLPFDGAPSVSVLAGPLTKVSCTQAKGTLMLSVPLLARTVLRIM